MLYIDFIGKSEKNNAKYYFRFLLPHLCSNLPLSVFFILFLSLHLLHVQYFHERRIGLFS